MTSPAEPEPATRLKRELGTLDAVVIGLGSMIGAGVFAVLGPAAAAAGSGLLVGLVIAAMLAFCNATSSAQLAAVYPVSGGTYVYGKERLGPMWGFLAGWGFIIGKTASCAAMALTFATYTAPGFAQPAAIGAVACLTSINVAGVQKTAGLTRAIVVIVLTCLAFVVAIGLRGGASVDHVGPITGGGWRGILQSAGLLFFAFAGYARIATLGEEVRDPRRTIPRAIPLALGITLVVYGAVAVAALASIGPARLAVSSAPLATVVRASGQEWAVGMVRAGAAIACLGVLLALLVGVSRTVFAMASQRDLPGWFDDVDPVRKVPQRAEIAVAVVVIAVVSVADVRGAIGFSSFAVLLYYAVANASAWTLTREERRWPRFISVVGGIGCIVVALTLPSASVIGGVSLMTVGAVVWRIRTRTSRT